MYIAVDFDGTLCEHAFPEIGKVNIINQHIINYIRKRKEQGDIIILWTCREDDPDRAYLSEAVQWCKDNNIPIDYVNENPLAVKEFGFVAPVRKIYADLYIDDKARHIYHV